MPRATRSRLQESNDTPFVLQQFSGGYNGYSSPVQLTPQMWAAASNVYSGLHGAIRRARFAPVVIGGTTSGYTAQAAKFTSLYAFRDPTPQEVLLGDVNNKLFSFNVSSNYTAAQRLNLYIDPSGAGDASLAGPWSRSSLFNQVFECNGLVKEKARGTLLQTIEGWGLDTPDASPSVSLSGGTITKVTGRSYRYAWENSNVSNVSAPSPATAYIAYSSQQGLVSALEAGTVTTNGTTTVTGSGTSFTSAWVGRRIWVNTIGGSANARIVSVQSATQLTTAGNITAAAGQTFQIYDLQTTNIRWYGTSDGGSTYFRMNQTTFDPTQTTVSGAGLSFSDNTNADPPNAPFTSELAQFFNVPPPIGTFVNEYQSRLLVYRVPGFDQTIFFSNIELTTVGNPPECFAPLNQFTLPIGDSKVNGMSSLPTGLIIWSDKDDMFKLTGTLGDNSLNTDIQLGSTLYRLPYRIGCASPWSSAVTPLGAIWLSSDRKVYLYTDHYAPRNVGTPIQDILNSITSSDLSNVRAAYYQHRDKNWYILAVNTGSAGQGNNKLLILDLDLLASNGQPSFFTFDMATNQPSWYIFDLPSSGGAIVTTFDGGQIKHILSGSGNDELIDVAYETGFFTITSELSVVGTTTLHAWGNDSAFAIKELSLLRFVTNQDPNLTNNQGWTFAINAIDDDKYTFASPRVTTLTPAVDSPIYYNWGAQLATTQSQFRFGPTTFKFGGTTYQLGRRFQYQINFPNITGQTLDLRSIQMIVRVLPPR